MSDFKHLDPVTFEVLKNAFINLVDQMSEQILRTCYSFVIYCRDFSSGLADANGDTVMQGSQDVAVHVGTLHLTAKAIIEAFGDDIHEGDVFIFNDPYTGGTHMCDTRVVRPVFYDGEIVSYMLCNGHWADVGGSTPGSFDVTAREHYGEGTRITPTRVWSKGKYVEDVANLIVANMRVSEDRLGDLRSQAEATRVGERLLHGMMDKYGKRVVLQAFKECQDYVERVVKAKVSALPDGVWEAVDYLDMDPDKEEGLIPVRVKMTIKGDKISYDFTGTGPVIGCFLNSAYPAAFSAVLAGTKTFFPEVPLNSGLYRSVEAILPSGTVVNAPWPTAVSGYCSGTYEKVMNAIFSIWSQIMPERAIACSFNIEYLLIGGWDKREAGKDSFFMWYDWMAGGHGGRNGKDGPNVCAPLFGLGLSVQPCEGQERLTPVMTDCHAIVRDSGGPGKYRGGCGAEKGGTLLALDGTVMSYCCDRARSIAWGINGGLPSCPHGVTVNPGKENEKYLGIAFSNYHVKTGDSFTRPSAGGGGLGDPLERDPKLVLEDVIDDYVSVGRAAKDYGVVVKIIDEEMNEFELDLEAAAKQRDYIRKNRKAWMKEDPKVVAQKYAANEIEMLDVFRQYGVILDWGTKELLPKTTEEYRKMLQERTVAYWD
jgi:N-methylhydantoinase B